MSIETLEAPRAGLNEFVATLPAEVQANRMAVKAAAWLFSEYKGYPPAIESLQALRDLMQIHGASVRPNVVDHSPQQRTPGSFTDAIKSPATLIATDGDVAGDYNRQQQRLATAPAAPTPTRPHGTVDVADLRARFIIAIDGYTGRECEDAKRLGRAGIASSESWLRAMARLAAFGVFNPVQVIIQHGLAAFNNAMDFYLKLSNKGCEIRNPGAFIVKQMARYQPQQWQR